MKRKRNSDSFDKKSQTYDLVLTDADGRSVRVHKALLIDRSEYFARVLTDHESNAIHLDERYLVELINYLYRSERCASPADDRMNMASGIAVDTENLNNSFDQGDTEILMHLLSLSAKYGFHQLHRELAVEVSYRLSPASVITVFNCAVKLGMKKLIDETKLMILSWLPQLHNTDQFLSLSEDSINQIFLHESPEIDSECKLNALSVWWSRNRQADMTNLWVKLITTSTR